MDEERGAMKKTIRTGKKIQVGSEVTLTNYGNVKVTQIQFSMEPEEEVLVVCDNTHLFRLDHFRDLVIEEGETHETPNLDK